MDAKDITMARIHNPIIPGFHPDPSVCRVGEDYYIVTSSFEFFPGVPLFHSRDLLHWRQLGHVLTRDSQLPLHGAAPSMGIWAPTIRHHQGAFYMTTTNMSGGLGNFYVTAPDPHGPWSDPIRVDQGGIDPTIFFDDDGTAYYLTNAGAVIAMSVIDIATGTRQSDVIPIWPGSGGCYPEAPHLYKLNGWYYLLIAEGGTEYGHMITMARSREIWGPYEPCPRNPLLTHRHRADLPVQGVGHGDLVQDQQERWWMVLLGFRPATRQAHHLGRETLLIPVTWDAEGWPVLPPSVDLEIDTDTLPRHPWPACPTREDFTEPALAPHWTFLRNPAPESWSLTARPGWLRLCGNAAALDDLAAPAFVGRRQQYLYSRMTALLECTLPHDGDEAGLTAFYNATHHYELAIRNIGGHRHLVLRQRIGSLQAITATHPIDAGSITLEITATPTQFTFGYQQGDSPRTTIGTTETRYLSSEVTGGYTGVFFALYAAGEGAIADIDWCEYTPG